MHFEKTLTFDNGNHDAGVTVEALIFFKMS